MLKALFLLMLSPAITLAEGRDDPFLKCQFKGGRTVVLAENGDDLVWIENNADYPATRFGNRDGGHLVTIHADARSINNPSLTVFTKDITESAPAENGDALLTWTTLSAIGKFKSHALRGKCKEFNG